MIDRATVYRWLLRAYPRSFRRQFGDEMSNTFAALARDHVEHPLRFWRFVLADVARSATREHVDVWTCGMRQLAMRWIGGCTLATAGSGIAIAIFIMLVNALFPPRVYPTGAVYAFGNNLPFGVYGAVIGWVIGAGQAWALRSHVRAWQWIPVTAVAAAAGMTAGTSVWSVVPLWSIGYFIGVTVLGFVVGLVQSMLLKTEWRGRLAWAGWTALAMVLAIATAVQASGWIETAPWPLRGLLAFILFPAVIGLVMSATTVGPLSRIVGGSSRRSPA